MNELDLAPRFPVPFSQQSWARLKCGSLYNVTGSQSYELIAAPSGGFILLGLEISAVWFIDARDESTALFLVDQYIYPDH